MVVVLARLPAYIGLVNLHDCFKCFLVFLFLHRLTYLLKHTPRGLIRTHTQLSFQLQCRYAFTGNKNEIHGIQPHTQIKVCILEYRTFQCRKLALAVIAIHEAMIVLLMIYAFVYASAFRTNIAILILSRNDEIYCAILVRKPFCKIKVCHISLLLELQRYNFYFNSARLK